MKIERTRFNLIFKQELDKILGVDFDDLRDFTQFEMNAIDFILMNQDTFEKTEEARWNAIKRFCEELKGNTKQS